MSGDMHRWYSSELKDRAVRMVAENVGEYESEWAAVTRVAGLLGVGTPETVRKWVRQAQVDAGARSGVSNRSAGCLPSPRSVLSSPAETKNVVMTVNSEVSLKYRFDRIDDMAKSPVTEVVIVGTVVKTKDVYVAGLAYRLLEVQVGDSLKKEVGKTVTIYEDGGIIPLGKVLPDIQAHSDVPLQAQSNDYVDMRFMGAPHTEVGNQIIAFVRSNPNDKKLIPADFQLVSSAQAILVRTQNSSEYVRRGVEPAAQPAAETSISASSAGDRLVAATGETTR